MLGLAMASCQASGGVDVAPCACGTPAARLYSANIEGSIRLIIELVNVTTNLVELRRDRRYTQSSISAARFLEVSMDKGLFWAILSSATRQLAMLCVASPQSSV
jgi:hypothetical protein